MERKGMVKGKMAKGIADMHFMVKGPKGQAEISLTGTLKEGSKTEYDLGSITARKRSKDEENIVTIYEDGKPTVAFLPRLSEALSSPEPGSSAEGDAKGTTAAEKSEKQQNGFLLNKPWYYRVGLAVAAGAVMGIILSLMIMSSRQAPKSSSAYQSLMVLLRENAVAKEVLGDNVGSLERGEV